jgi:hypothetical protein
MQKGEKIVPGLGIFRVFERKTSKSGLDHQSFSLN